jgi:hypothetical protein
VKSSTVQTGEIRNARSVPPPAHISPTKVM